MPPTEKRRNRSIKNERVETLLNCLVVDQLRTVLSKVSSESKKPRSREDAIELILNSGANLASIVEAIYDVELHTPQKHVFTTVISKFKEKSELKPPIYFKSQAFPEIGKIEILYVNNTDQKFSVLFEHSVAVTELLKVPDSPDLYRKIDSNLRHSLALHINKTTGTLLITYPGFSQGRGRKKRIEYANIIAVILSFFETSERFEVKPTQFRVVLNELASANSKRVKVTQTHPRSAVGELDVKGYGSSSSLETLVNFIVPYLKINRNDLESAVEAALKNSNSSSEIALWVKEKVFSRVTYWEFGAELLFVWRGVSPSFYLFNEILDLVRSVSYQLDSGDLKKAWTFITAKPASALITTSELVNALGLTNTQAKSTISAALKSGVLTPVYKLKTELTIEQFENGWTDDLSLFAQIFTDVDRTQEIDGSDPTNIEVAFKRVTGVESASH